MKGSDGIKIKNHLRHSISILKKSEVTDPSKMTNPEKMDTS